MINRSIPSVARALLGLGLTGLAVRAQEISVPLKLDPTILTSDGSLWGQLTFFNDEIPLAKERPAAVKQEPKYNGTPEYGQIKLGNGPKSVTLVVFDRPNPPIDWNLSRIYVDVNQNGDLTDDGDGKWPSVQARGDAARLGTLFPLLHASWGTPEKETASADYSVMLVSVGLPNKGQIVSYRRSTGRTGTLPVAGRDVRVVLIENDNDALFNKTLDDDNRLTGPGRVERPLWLLADLDGDGIFGKTETFDARKPFVLGGATYEARAPMDGSKLTLVPTTRVAQRAGVPVPRPFVGLAPGTVAPDFTALLADGTSMKLSELRGKIVVLDFWATWCGPCVRSMPTLDQLYTKLKDQGLTVLGLCVSDDRTAFDQWMVTPKVKTSYPKVFDPNGVKATRDNAEQRAKGLGVPYKVNGIPTMYVIDREGKIIDGILGFGGDDDDRLAKLLVKTGLKL
ncbi:MAG: TlpA family protein disulfide reductase [Opitutus sp.]|nr:TlpA family protein disulfide reductase [Opitutus sp.]